MNQWQTEKSLVFSKVRLEYAIPGSVVIPHLTPSKEAFKGFAGGSVLKICLPMQEMQVSSLV